jgi:osmotically-inducible protein OsmY
MADRDRWNDDMAPRRGDRDWRGDADTAWHGQDRSNPNNPDREAARGYMADADGRQRDRDDYDRSYGAGDYEGQRRWREDERAGEGRGRDDDRGYTFENRGGSWPSYDPGPNGPEARDRGGPGWRGEAGASARPSQRYTPEGRGGYRGEAREEDRNFWDRTRDEVASWFGDRGAEQRRRADGEHRGRGPKGYRRSDARISEDVHDRLTEDSWLDASDVEVHVRDGEVTLSGRVRPRDDKRRAEDLAERVSGVTHVQNNLRAEDMRGGFGLTSSNYPL